MRIQSRGVGVGIGNPAQGLGGCSSLKALRPDSVPMTLTSGQQGTTKENKKEAGDQGHQGSVQFPFTAPLHSQGNFL